MTIFPEDKQIPKFCPLIDRGCKGVECIFFLDPQELDMDVFEGCMILTFLTGALRPRMDEIRKKAGDRRQLQYNLERNTCPSLRED